MKNLPFDTFGLSEKTIKNLIGIMVEIQEEYKCTPVNNFQFPIQNFRYPKEFKNVKPAVAYQTHPNTFVTISEVQIRETGPRNRKREVVSLEQQVWGFGRLAKDYGTIIMRPETLIDKISELVKPVEIDFDEDKKFSDSIYLLGEDEEKTRKLVNQKFRDIVRGLSPLEFVLECSGKDVMICSTKRADSKSAVAIAEFLKKMITLY